MRKFYEKKLKLQAFNAFRENRNENYKRAVQMRQAERFDVLWTKRLFFEAWLSKLDQKYEINQLHIVYKARRHYENKITLLSFKAWISFVAEQRKYKVNELIIVSV